MEPLSIKDIQLFYLTIVFCTMLIASIAAFRFWQIGKKAYHEHAQCLLFIALIAVTLGLPPFGRLLSLIFPGAFANLELMSSLYKIISIFNNLFIILTVRALPANAKRFSLSSNLSIIILFVSVNMLLMIVDKFVIGGYPIGKSLIILVDSFISIFCIFLLGKALSSFLKETMRETYFLLYIYQAFVWILSLLVASSAVIFFITLAYPNFKPNGLSLLIIYSLYFLSVSFIMGYLLLASYLMLRNNYRNQLSVQRIGDTDILEEAFITIEEADSSLETGSIAENEIETDFEILPQQVFIDFDQKKNAFSIKFICDPNEKTFIWTGESCNYPFFYWLYLAIACDLDIKVEIKNAQVMRNKMVQLISRSLKPKNFIALSGEIAALNISKEFIYISEKVFTSSLVKSKFRLHIDPFLILTKYDAEKFQKDNRYNEYIFLETYDKIREKYASDI
ncbi:MAG: hypothetical protein ACOYKE_08300 [Ferruginibacter sp.]